MIFCRVLLALLAVGTLTAESSAGLITSVTSSNLSRATVAVSQLPTMANSNVLNMAVTLLQKNVPFDLVFTAPTGPQNNNTYTINMTVVNNITGGANGYINGFDLVNLFGAANVTPGWSGILVTNTPVSPYLALQMVNGANVYNITGGWRFGGINGGGPPLYNGDSATVSFKYQQKTPIAGVGDGTTRLRFTANPEPATLLLGALVMAPAFVALRRRRKVSSELVESV